MKVPVTFPVNSTKIFMKTKIRLVILLKCLAFIYLLWVCLFVTNAIFGGCTTTQEHNCLLVHRSCISTFSFTYNIYIYHSFSFFTTHTTRNFHTEAVFATNDSCGILLENWQVQANSGPATTQKLIYSVMYRRLVVDKNVLVD